jgi:hypothetical protein
MTWPAHDQPGWPAVVAAVLLAGLPILDTILVTVSRRRRGIPVVTAGTDHLTHRLLARMGSVRMVALALATAQLALAGLAHLIHIGRGPLLGAFLGCVVLAIAVVALLERPAWSPTEREPIG